MHWTSDGVNECLDSFGVLQEVDLYDDEDVQFEAIELYAYFLWEEDAKELQSLYWGSEGSLGQGSEDLQ